MYGYMPTYKQLVEPTKTITLFENVYYDLQNIKPHENVVSSDLVGFRRYGLCVVRNDTIGRQFMKPGFKAI